VLVVSCLMCNMMLMLACLNDLSAYLLTHMHLPHGTTVTSSQVHRVDQDMERPEE